MLDAQLSENKSVLEELTGMTVDNKVRTYIWHLSPEI